MLNISCCYKIQPSIDAVGFYSRHLLLTATLLAAGLWGGAALAQGNEDQQIQELEQKVKRLNTSIDIELMRLFRDQVQAGVYRMRLKDLQQEWQVLFAQVGLKRKKPKLPPLDPNEFRIEEAAGSDATALERAVVSPSCKRRSGCRIWAKIGFGKKLVKKKPLEARVWAEVKNKTGSRRLAVPAQIVKVDKTSMVLSLDLGKLSIYQDSYEGNLQVVCNGRYKSRSFKFDLLKTY